ncbi:MAG: protease [Calditrichaeota bacterium]|nr:MAG: protease [Calditrichota bacterium]
MKWRWLVFALILIGSFAQAEEARLLRFPATNDDQIVFTFAGDLYTVNIDGGVARKLTNHDGYEMFARFSPDGKTLAFTGQYDGNTEVFTMPASGGSPQRLTFTATLGRDDIADRMGPNNIVMAWKNDGSQIAFRSRMRSFNSFNGSLYLVDLKGNLPQEIPVMRGGFLSFSPDDKKMAYNRIFREFRTWKRYRGGMADEVWVFDFATKKIENISKNEAQDIIPMWIGDKIYFLSDRDKRFNLYVYDTTTKTTTKLTNYTEFDIKFPSAGKENIVYENGGFIYKFNLASGQATKVNITIAEDMLSSRRAILKAKENITNFEIAPDGKRALFGARGDVFTVPAKEGLTYNLTQTPAVHERNSKWSPDGQWIAYISDQTGEDEIFMRKADGSDKPVQVTKNAETYKYQMYWSPDSKKLLWADRKQRLRFIDVASKTVTEVVQATAWEVRNYTWSPDSKWIAYTFPEEEVMNRIYMYSVASGKSTPVTDGWYSSGNAAFSSDGKYLLFTSNRDFSPSYSWTEWNHSYQDMAKVYLVTLDKNTPSPFAPENDTVAVKKDEKKADAKSKKEEKKKETPKITKVDLDGILDRIVVLPVEASRYFNLGAVGSKVYYNRNGSDDKKTVLMLYDLEKEKETELGNINGYEFSADFKKMLVVANGSYAIIDLPSGTIKMDEKLDVSNMEYVADYQAEWQQIFTESWRQMREFFYVPNMHGLDWEAVRVKYQPLVKYAHHRNDLTYIIGEMIGELNVGHAYVGGGDRPKPARIQTGLLGAELAKDGSGYFKITRILKGENWTGNRKSPLTAIGVNAKEGEYIVAVNGVSTKNMANLFIALVGKAGKSVELSLNSQAAEAGSRKVLVQPIADESGLYYYNWVNENIAKVNKATGGKVGYLHIPDMGPGGLNEFVKRFYPQLRKKALIVDVRGNGGGNVSPMIIERLRREAVMINVARNASPGVNPGSTIYGPIICLADEFSASDGDIFAYRFKEHKLGKVVGKRTWGGVVGIRGSLPFIDGGDLRKPEFSRYDLEGQKWLMEGYGVEPDIFVDNDPHKEYLGEDEQLNRAISEILQDLANEEKQIPGRPAAPDKK